MACFLLKTDSCLKPMHLGRLKQIQGLPPQTHDRDSFPLPKCGSVSLIFCWLLLFGEKGLKRDQGDIFAHSSLPPTWIIPICEPHIIGQTYVWLLHLGIYIHQRKLMDEFHMCFPGVCGMFPFLDWGKCSVQLLGIEYLRCQCFFFYLITSPASSSHSMFNNNLKKTNGLKLYKIYMSLFFKVDTLWRRLL